MTLSSYRHIVVSSIAPLLLTTFVLQGCLPGNTRPVSEANKDTSGTYDGTWTAVGKSTAAVQQGIGNWRHNCSDRSGQRYGPIYITEGEATLWLDSNKGTTFIDPEGKFRLEIPLNAVAKASGTSDSSINNGKMTFILTGSLQDQTGNMIFGIAELGNSGCRSAMTFEKS